MKTCMGHEIGYQGYFYMVIGKILSVIVDELFGFWVCFHSECYEKDVFSFLLNLGLFAKSWILGTGSFFSFIVITNTLEIIVQILAILFNPWVIRISIASSNNKRLTMFV